jgi:Ca2+-transporting ATPase
MLTLLRPMHLLWINLITDTFPAIALGMEEGEADLMKREPRDDKEGIFSHGLGLNIVLQGVYIGILTLVAFYIGVHIGGDVNGQAYGSTMAFLTLSMTEMFHAFNARSISHSVFSLKKQNKYLWGAFLFSLLTTLVVIYVPGLNTSFGFSAIDWKEYLIAVALAITVIPFVELSKWITRKVRKAD